MIDTLAMAMRRDNRASHGRARLAQKGRLMRCGAVLGLVAIGCMVPGGGGTVQSFPDTVHVGQPATFRIDLTAVDIKWAWGRFRDLKLFYRMVGDTSFRSVPPSRRMHISRASEAYEFVVPPLAHEKRGMLEFYFTFAFDGVPNRIPGSHPIPVE